MIVALLSLMRCAGTLSQPVVDGLRFPMTLPISSVVHGARKMLAGHRFLIYEMGLMLDLGIFFI